MTLSTVAITSKVQGKHIVPVADQTEWKALCRDPKTADTANLLKPSDITRTGQLVGELGYAATSLLVCLRYQTGQAVTTPPAIKLVGISDAGVPQLLEDADGNSSFTLTPDTLADLKDAAGNSYTAPVEVDGQNNGSIMSLITTALVGGGTVDTAGSDAAGSTLGPQIMVKAK